MILPADSYIVVNKSIITEIDKKILIDLYQPIIGHNAISFYFTLLNDLEKNEIISENYNHHHLMTIMQISLEDLKRAKELLEAIGLLKTYLKKNHINNYVYVLYSPISADEFLNHPILNVVLYNNIGKKEYENIVESYKIPKINLSNYEDISASFDEIFISVPKDGLFTNEDLVAKNNNKLSFIYSIDFDLLISGLDVNEKIFTKDIKDLISNLCFIYSIDITTIQNLIRNCLNEKGLIDKNLLRKSARNYYQFENNGALPSLIYSTQPTHLKTPVGDKSLRAKMIYTFENTNPYQFIKSKYKDGKVITRDLQIIENLLIDLKLTPAVVNVLLDYVLRINNQKLNKNFIETIASNWKRRGIETAQEAMDACLKEYKKGNKSVSKKENIVPDWFNNELEKKEIEGVDKEEINELLKDYS